MGKGILIAVVAVLVLSACGASATPTPTVDLISANLRVTDFERGSVIEKKPSLIGEYVSRVRMKLPDGFTVRSEVSLQGSPAMAAANVQNGCTAHTYWKLVISPGIGDVSRTEWWTREGPGHIQVVCFSVRNLLGMVINFGEPSYAKTDTKYARLLEKRMLEELQNPTGGS